MGVPAVTVHSLSLLLGHGVSRSVEISGQWMLFAARWIESVGANASFG